MENGENTQVYDNATKEGLQSFFEEYDKAIEDMGKTERTEVPTETPQMELPLETKEETPVVEAEVPKEETTEAPQENTLFELLTSTDTPAETIAEDTQVELPADVQERLQLVEQYENQLKAINENPLLKALAMAESPEQIRKIAREIAGEDVTKLSINELLTREAQALGLQGEDLQMAIEEEIQSYESMSRIKRAEYEKQLRAKYDKGGESELLKQLEAAFQNKQQEKIDPVVEEKQLQEAVKQDEAALGKIASKYIGQEINGVKIGEEFSKKLQDAYYSDAYRLFDDNGNFKADRFAQLVFWSEYGTKLLAAQKEAAKKELIKERSNPSKDGIVGSQTPQTDNRTDDERLIEGILSGEIKRF